MAASGRDRMRSTTGRRRCVILACLAGTLASTAAAGGASRLVFEEHVKADGSSSVTVSVNRTAAFRLTLKSPAAGRTRVYLTGSNVPNGTGAVLDTAGECEGAAGSVMCRAAFEALAAGSYKFRVKRNGSAANVVLTVRW